MRTASDDADARPRIGLALVARDEERFLAANLAYHRALGVSRAYVHLDRCTDDSEAIARRFEAGGFATVLPSDRDAGETYMSEYQVRCLDDALRRARADGLDWLMHVDADEFAWGDNPAGPLDAIARLVGRGGGTASGGQRLRRQGDLRRMVRRAATLGRLRGGGRIDQVIMRTVEVVPTPLQDDEDFRHLHWFQDGGVLPREILDPGDGEVKTLDHWLGGRRGKSLVRCAADVVPRSAHDWSLAGGGDPVTARAGLHYHYVVADAAHWLEKYRKFSEYPEVWEKGKPVRFPKQAWKQASVRMTDDEAAAYFARWVAADPAELARLSRTPAGRHLRRDEAVARVLAGAGA